MTQSFGTKAETLALLQARGFAVPPLYYFDAGQWQHNANAVVNAIEQRFAGQLVAVRSSAKAEDTAMASLAGAFHSELNVPCESDSLRRAVEKVLARYSTTNDQVLVQPMLAHVQIAGVIMTRTLDDGSPYYVFNYDDISGTTDSVTSGNAIPKMVYVYKGVSDEDFDSSRLRMALRLARALESIFEGTPLDIEFAVDTQGKAWLLQVRPICTAHRWKKKLSTDVSARIKHVETFVRTGLRPRPGLYGRRTIYGVMPDWNPAEIIGIVPRPLDFSLYRNIITREVWSKARARMGYHPVPPVDLMLSVAGRPYIDVRASFNSLLPAGLPSPLAEKLLNAWLDRLDAHPELHDKVEFEIVPTVLDFDLEEKLDSRYPGLLDQEERTVLLKALRRLTQVALQPDGTLDGALNHAGLLLSRALPDLEASQEDLVVQLPALLEDCRQMGTVPFSVAARHAFMAESLLRSAMRCNALTQERLDSFKRSVSTISSQLSTDFATASASGDDAQREHFLARYGHLRPGTYDITSPNYVNRTDLFSGNAVEPHAEAPTFALTAEEKQGLTTLLHKAGLHTAPETLLAYAGKAIAGREYIKFVFTRHLSHILELLAAWGKGMGLSRSQIAMIPLDDILLTLLTPLPSEPKTHFLGIVRKQRALYELASSFKLSQLIRSTRDVYIAPVHRALPNFITAKVITAPITMLHAEECSTELKGRLICIESADPGYDWIFTRGIAGLITRFGGANSHMAIRCAEYGIPAAIGCGALLFEKVAGAPSAILDCAGKKLQPLSAGESGL